MIQLVDEYSKVHSCYTGTNLEFRALNSVKVKGLFTTDRYQQRCLLLLSWVYFDSTLLFVSDKVFFV